MSITSTPKRIIAGGAVALGLALGVTALASAATSPAQSAPSTTTAAGQQDPGTSEKGEAPEKGETPETPLNGSVQTPDKEYATDAEEAKALEGLAKISPADAEKAAVAAVAGSEVSESAELENEDGSVIYDVEVTAKGKTVEVEVDAGNAKVLDQEVDDDDEDDGCKEDKGEAHEANEVPEAPAANEAPATTPGN